MKKKRAEETRMGYCPFSSPGRDTVCCIATGRAWARMARRMVEHGQAFSIIIIYYYYLFFTDVSACSKSQSLMSRLCVRTMNSPCWT